jgi:hypothetical protein
MVRPEILLSGSLTRRTGSFTNHTYARPDLLSFRSTSKSMSVLLANCAKKETAWLCSRFTGVGP